MVSKASRSSYLRIALWNRIDACHPATRDAPSPTPARVLRRQRGVPLRGTGLRGAAVRAPRRARRGVAADRLGGGDLRAVAAAVADAAGGRPAGAAAAGGLGRDP